MRRRCLPIAAWSNALRSGLLAAGVPEGNITLESFSFR